jgi:phage shock protein PspC (stress-responsive transcriptional regulator)
MKKTVTANISGLVFHIDEDAYDKLNLYLARIRERLAAESGRDEIITDIESRIAEMLQEKLSSVKKVITIEDVKGVIDQLGEPEQFEQSTDSTAGSSTYSGYYEQRTERRFYRDPDDKYIGGVAGGLGAYLNLDPLWIRIAFVVTTFVYGFGPLLYIILWIVVPKARTTAEKLEMKGRRVTLSNIEMSIKEELSDLKKNFKEFSDETREHLKKKGNTRAIRNKSASMAADLVDAFAKVAGVFLILITFGMLMTLVSGVYMIPFGLFHSHGLWMVSIPEILSALLSSDVWVQATLIAMVAIVGIPLLWIFLVGVQLLFDVKTTNRYVGALTFVIWVTAIGTLAFATLNGVRNFSGESVSREDHVLADSDWPNFYIQLDEMKLNQKAIPSHRNRNKVHTWHTLWQESEQQAMGLPTLRIRPSSDNRITLEILRESFGSSPQQANINASQIQYSFTQRDSLLILDPVFYFDKHSGWRNQNLTLELSLPENKIAVLHKNIKNTLPVHRSNNVNVLE